MINESNVYKSPSITVSPRNYIIGSNFDAENIYIKEIETDTYAIDEAKQLKEKLSEIQTEINCKKNELTALENKTLLELQQQKINMLRAAEEEAKNIIQKAGDDISLAKDSGYQEGYNEGYKTAIETFKNDTAQIINTLNAVVLKIEAEKKKYLLDMKYEILEIIKKCINHLLNKEIESYGDDVLINNLTELLSDVAAARELIIKVHPSNVEKIENIKAQIEAELSAVEKIKIIGAQNVDVAGCVLETDKGNFDARLKTKFENVFGCLKQIVEEL